MKNKFLSSVFLVAVSLINYSFSYAQEAKTLTTMDGSKIAVVNRFDSTPRSIKISEIEFEATLESFGKSNGLNKQILKLLKAKNRKTFNKVREITTALSLSQGETLFYISGLNSIDLAPFRGKKPRVNCRAIVLTISTSAETVVIPIITKIRET